MRTFTICRFNDVMSIDPVLWEKALMEFNEEKFFECHETLEKNWLRETDAEQKNLLQGIIHIAAAFLHYRNRNRIGYRRQLEKGRAKLRAVRLDRYSELLKTDLKWFYKEISSADPILVFPKIIFIASEA